ncbi:CNNM family magnesium/cobalt transport protein CorC [Phocoenobacter skyensis]|uniref:Magnesium and cobalt efflux protein CorC n=1 Tax=Phocoenobacter skyensis TaxID=97481 RepID=A0A1H7XXX1_9PAST|nr:CNNM family magnesium/cobalt transport protein CorC [Pasteurella skyensis]MDP8079813.1 CNNM family magnesium/cobalt transport protein CorC [Pasteurella skyensis]MDP8085718.1 CNNM family magnesium/cobalt transport protein CorC [Pasteurella skyensis]MDP8161883.1 CNNM family magnesium/cobalt transport protein CorC [Pasteurella skyensis]MDP8171189.1 CNNM family magnesium/cobalt transport protein CorC [Pasteurella skyensis]MDP8172039.1 CNNM family magnesium/cobalt transport protein CorC [Pasteur
MDDNQNNAEKGHFFQSIFNRFFQGEPQNREDLVEVIRDSAENELIDNDTKDMIEGVIEMSELRVRDIMIPRAQMVFIEAEQPLESCVDTIIETTHSRFPVIRGDKDDIEGILLAKELLKYLRSDSQPFEMTQILRPAVIIPESKRVDRMLKEFRSERFHMAIVVDEFGAVSGLVTIEDILEQIVGDIEDEFDEEEAEPIRRLSKHSYAVSALTDIEDFNAFFGTNFEDEEVDTVGGLVMQAFGHLPQKGETIELEGIAFKVTAGNNRRLLQVRVTISDSQLEIMDKAQA